MSTHRVSRGGVERESLRLLACVVRPCGMRREANETRFFSRFRSVVIHSAFVGANVLAAPSCGPHPPQATAPALLPPAKTRLSGTLITYKSGRELWREHYEDDGETLVSQLSLGDRVATVRTSRSSRTVVVVDGPYRIERDIPDGTIALENGDWQAYAIAADWYADAREPRLVKVVVPGQGAVVDGTIAVSHASDGSREVKVVIDHLVLVVKIDPSGRVVEAHVPAQSLEVRAADAAMGSKTDRAPEAASATGANAAVANRSSIEVQHDGGTLSGELWLPKQSSGAVPLAVIVPGSGPTDRDGNSALGLRTEAYKQIAGALAERGIASLRYDKRGIGRSKGYREESITLTSSSSDLAVLVQRARNQAAFSSVTLVGHSEGGLVALQAIAHIHAAALVLLATPGRTLGAVLREQLIKAGVPAAEIDNALVEVRKGDAVSSPRPEIKEIFRPSVLPFLRSIVDVDPVALLRSAKVPTTIVQGDNDRQIPVEDAQMLRAARPDARVVVVSRMNHVLKTDGSEQWPQRSYADPAVPLAREVVEAIVDASRK
jgi:uncharacterized protein